MRNKHPSERSFGTLMLVVQTHIQTGEPVGSRTVARQTKEGLSPASIRNIMMDLEEEGYLEQPHPSAGRVPTGKAYRYYVSQIDGDEPPSKSDEELIQSHLLHARDLAPEELLGRTSRLLSLVSGNLGVALRLPVGSIVLDNIHFINAGDRRIVVVLVSPNSHVQDHMIRVDFDISQSELEAAANYLNRHYRGWALGKIREDLTARLAEERTAYDGMLAALKQLNDRGMLPESSPAAMFLEGASNLVGRPEFADPERLRQLIRAVEEKESIIRLLNQCIASSGVPVQVIIGLPGHPPLLEDFALVGSALDSPNAPSVCMAILGPARMQYDRAIRALGYIGKLLQQQNCN